MHFETILSFIDLPTASRIRGWLRLYRLAQQPSLVVLLSEVEGAGHLPMGMALENTVAYILRHVALPPRELTLLWHDGPANAPIVRLAVLVDNTGLLSIEQRPLSPDALSALIDGSPVHGLWQEKDNGSWVCQVGQWRGVAFPSGTPLGSRWESHVFNQRIKLNHSGPSVPTALRAKMWVLDIIANLSRESELWPGETTPAPWNAQDDDTWR